MAPTYAVPGLFSCVFDKHLSDEKEALPELVMLS